MTDNRLLACAIPVLVALLLGACGQANTGDAPPASASAVTGPNNFLLFPNPQVQADGSLQTNSTAYAQAYYAAIDPTNAKDTLAKWKAANGFDSGTGTQVEVVFGDVRDLGYGRRMIARQNIDGSIAAVVENYLVGAVVNYVFSTLNLDAAVLQDRRWHDNTNAIEFSPAPGVIPGPGCVGCFAKFFNFDAATGNRGLAVQLDGRGDKAMPGVCLSCHGGRGDALTPPGAGGQPLFPLVSNPVLMQRGDAEGRMMPLEVDTFAFSTTAGLTRADQEAALKTLNGMVLCAYPRPAAAPVSAEDACRRVASATEWQGTAADLIKNAYGGNGLPNATYSDTFVPAGWLGQESLYANVVAPACRACHLVRGYGTQSDIDLNTFAKFQGFADRTRAHVIDRGNMPLAKIVFQDFWASPTRVELLGAFLEAPPQNLSVRDSGGAVLRPGRPVAIPGPNRVVLPGATPLTAAGSLYATSFQWSIVVPGPGGATLDNANSAQATFNATLDGTYGLQLIASSAGVASAPAPLTIVVNSTPSPATSAIDFTNIKGVLQTVGCTGCHTAGGFGLPPIDFTNIDRDGSGGAADMTDDLWFYTELRGRINFADLEASPLLRKPSGNHHRGGGPGATFDASLAPGQPGRVNYDLFLNWILNGAPQ
jgi:mono/diheme cytochrome c family protein